VWRPWRVAPAPRWGCQRPSPQYPRYLLATASVLGAESDPAVGNNTVMVFQYGHSVGGPAAQRHRDARTGERGTALTYTATLTNAGPSLFNRVR